jgi:palmitoyl-protein thioesterase
MRQWIAQAHPGTVTVAVDLFEGLSSLTPLDVQLPKLTAWLKNLTASDAAWSNGYHVIGHSQGGLLMRALIENSDFHNVHQFITLAGAVNGVFGEPAWVLQQFGNLTLEALTDLLYTPALQRTLSLANFWKDAADPSYYLKSVQFLPTLNNEVGLCPLFFFPLANRSWKGMIGISGITG